MQTVGQILRSRFPSAGEKLAFLAGYQPDTTYPDELDGGYYHFPGNDSDGLRIFFQSYEFHNARAQGAQITMLQRNCTSVWIKYPRGSAFYRRKLREAIIVRNNQKRKKLFFLKLGKLLLDSLTTPKQNPA